MATRFELVTLALPADLAPEAVPQTAAQLIAACWPGMGRAQLLDRARRLALRPLAGLSADGHASFTLRLTLPASMAAPVSAAMAVSVPAAAGVIDLVAHVRRLARRRAGARRAKVSLPPARDTRQMGLF